MAIASDAHHPANQRVSRSSRGSGKKPWPLRVIGVLLTSLVFSFLFEWIGLTFFWSEQGAMHSAEMLETELQYLNDDFRTTVFGNTPAEAISSLAALSYYYVFQWTRFEDLLNYIGGETGLGHYVAATITIFQVFLVRLGILTFSLPVFALFALVGVTSGLTLRDIRRWSAGREFGGVYHRAKWIAPKAVIVAWLMYLAIPISFHPNTIILPCAVLFGINLMILSASFKKYL